MGRAPDGVREERVVIDGVVSRRLRVSARDDSHPALVFFHGYLDSADTWREVLAQLGARGIAADAYDLPSFGKAELMPAGPMLGHLTRFARYAVVSSAKAHGRDVTVVGNSMGGAVALRVAEDHTLPLAGCVPISPAGFGMDDWSTYVDRYRTILSAIGGRAPVSGKVRMRLLAGFYPRVAAAAPHRVDPWFTRQFAKHNADRKVGAHRIKLAMKLIDELEDAFDHDMIEVPTLILWGDRDVLCWPRGAKELDAKIPHARLYWLANIGHSPQIEVPSRVAELVTRAHIGPTRSVHAGEARIDPVTGMLDELVPAPTAGMADEVA